MAKASDNPFPSVLLVEQAAAPATPDAGQARLYRGTDNKLYIVDDAGTATEVGAGGGSGGGSGIIAYISRNPATLATYNMTATSLTDVDAANMAVTFTAPSSGKVLVRLTACAARGATTGTGYWGLRSGTTQVGSLANVRGGLTGIFPSTAEIPVTGLTPGDTYTYKWAAQVDNGTLSIYAGGPTGGIAGPAVMTVLALP